MDMTKMYTMLYLTLLVTIVISFCLNEISRTEALLSAILIELQLGFRK